jgi:hypothetical protein
MTTTSSLEAPEDEDDLRAYSLNQVAERLSVSLKTVRRMVEAGELEAFKPLAPAAPCGFPNALCGSSSARTEARPSVKGFSRWPMGSRYDHLMSTDHEERMLLAEYDVEAARSFRGVAEEVLKIQERAVELYAAIEDAVPDHVQRARDKAEFEYKQLCRLCLQHSARIYDEAHRAEGRFTDMESAVMLFNITKPVPQRS